MQNVFFSLSLNSSSRRLPYLCSFLLKLRIQVSVFPGRFFWVDKLELVVLDFLFNKIWVEPDTL